MRGKCVFLMCFALIVSAVKFSYASIILHEILADPALGILGDANKDGIRSSVHDEFIELCNMSDADMQIGNWYLTDNTSVRHVFDSEVVIEPHGLYVVFGGGSPVNIPSMWDISSTKTLGLNNGGDNISLFDADDMLIDQISYGIEASYDQSMTRIFQGQKSAWVKHSELNNEDDEKFSPGYMINEARANVSSNVTVPEPSTIAMVFVGIFSVVVRRKLF